ncbi:hypothetical protein Q3G72_035363 [Acer saccharum]|nr:hypothetical protein Q3G72_035363 [Acer saccharum]
MCSSLNSVRTDVAVVGMAKVVESSSFLDFVLSVYKSVDLSFFEFLCVVWWKIWFRRNKHVHSQILLPASEILSGAFSFVHDYRAANERKGTAALVTRVDPSSGLNGPCVTREASII